MKVCTIFYGIHSFPFWYLVYIIWLSRHSVICFKFYYWINFLIDWRRDQTPILLPSHRITKFMQFKTEERGLGISNPAILWAYLVYIHPCDLRMMNNWQLLNTFAYHSHLLTFFAITYLTKGTFNRNLFWR